LAGTIETPGTVVYKDRVPHKVYRGMASVEAQIDWRGHTSSEEGVTSMVPTQGSVHDVLSTLEKGIRSGLSYSGTRTIAELQAKGKFISQSSAGMAESSTHIKKMNRHK
jgi:IMP dehydrogenase